MENPHNGAPEEIRTPDPQIRSLVLYPAELRVHTLSNFVLSRQGVPNRFIGELQVKLVEIENFIILSRIHFKKGYRIFSV